MHRGGLVLGLVRLDHDPGERRERREDGGELVLVLFPRAARLDARGRPRAPCIEAAWSSASFCSTMTSASAASAARTAASSCSCSSPGRHGSTREDGREAPWSSASARP
ncbi:hypothetical protein KEG38_43095 [Polyangium jinanense]|uniref:hypothetical protein n=1 Tax=Polyangium jinanense TaxID=2829994 RepID=UPI0023408291|nr:hypothetical protein [Polyangium jinanense]MDC3960718.1 hypothetical protein [Polyangium jinanense]